MSSSITLLALPPELIEAILISSCSPRTVASVAQTCRTLHTLVYGSPDSHLWRELFLTTWDDPRPALEHRALVDPRIDPTALDWATEYRRRVSADKWLKAWRRDICLAEDAETAQLEYVDAEWHNTALVALSAVLDTLLTLRPYPTSSPIALTVLTSATPSGNAESGVGNRRETTSAPPLPPLLIVLASGISLIEESRSGRRVGRMVYGPHAARSRPLGNGPGRRSGPAVAADPETSLTPIPTPSLPPQLVRTLLASRTIGVRGLSTYKPSLSPAGHWRGDPLGDAFHRIVCITGFVPVPPPLGSTAACAADESALGRTAEVKNQDAEEHSEMQGDGEEQDSKSDGDRTPKPFPTPSQQYADARILARRRVYDMQYLRGDRLWGPYHVVTRVSPKARPGSSRPVDHVKGKPEKEGKRPGRRGVALGRGGVHRIGALAWAMGADIEPDEYDSDSTSDDSKDEDWHDPVDRGQGSSATTAAAEDTADGDTGAEVEPEEPEHPLLSLILSSAVTADTTDIDPTTNTTSTSPRRRTRRSNPRLPPNCAVPPREIKPHHLRPDYTYLASARIVVESNMRDLFDYQVSDNVERTASESRPGGVGMFWEDEDEILRAQARSSNPAFSASYASSSLTTTPSSTPANNNTETFELADILAHFKNLEVARLGSACGYWSGWIERQQSSKGSTDASADASPSSSEGDSAAKRLKIVTERAELETPVESKSTSTTGGKGKGKEKDVSSAPVTGLGDWETGPEGEACEGWDWAGVAGVWRRCVCWMDYRELLFFNLDPNKFLTLDTQEACRIIPMELRITGYTRAALMPVYDTDERSNINVLHPDDSRHKTSTCTGYFRPPPVIHYSGVSVGSDRSMDDGRRVRGSVQLIGGGEVRWQLDTYTQESSTAEWSSESIQVGGIGSAVGLLGMWTGAGHERADPLGPFWAWKVV